MNPLSLARRCAFFLLAGMAPLPLLGQGLPRAVAERLAAAGLPAAALGAVVRRADDGREVAAWRAQEARAPASTIKLLTSAAALEILGPAWRGSTEMLVSGEVRRGELRGDVILRGRADVDFDARELRRMATRLRLGGVRRIRGDLVLDRSYFTPPRTDVGLPPFDEAPEFRYNVVPDALTVGMNLVDLEIVSDAKGVRVAAWPSVDGVEWRSALAPVVAPCDDWEELWRTPEVRGGPGSRIEVVLRGPFPRDCGVSTSLGMVERTRQVEGLFRALWREGGGTWTGRAREAAAPSTARPIALHRSRPLADLVHDVDKRSDNPIARTVWLAIGANAPGDEGEATAIRSERAVRAWLASKGLRDEGLVLENGSGLSRRERISPALLADVVGLARLGPWAPEFTASLPIVGVDGGMRTRATAIAPGAARIKTGTLRDASAIAGWVASDDGATYIVVAMVNGERATKEAARPVLDALLEWVARGLPED